MKSFHRGHNQHVRPDEQMSDGPMTKGASPRQKRATKRESRKKRRMRERTLERER